jgi:hypothetical protein
MRIFSQSRGQESVRSSAGAPQLFRFYPTTEVGYTVGDLDHAAVSLSDGMQFDVSVQGHALNVCLKTDKA